MLTVIITSIGRSTLIDAVKSCQGWPTIVVHDGPPDDHDVRYDEILQANPDARLFCTGQKYGNYGAVAWNMGVAAAPTPYIAKLDDDDEFLPGALRQIEESITNIRPQADIYIPGLQFNDGGFGCLNPGLAVGNVACPIMKTTLAVEYPMTKYSLPPQMLPAIDFFYVMTYLKHDKTIRWLGVPLISVRPKLPGRNGDGKYEA